MRLVAALTAAFAAGVLVGMAWWNYADHVQHWGGLP